MPTIVFTSHLQRHVTCAESTVQGSTLREALDAVFASQPQVRGYILDDQARLRKHIAVFIDGQRSRDRDALSDAVRADSEIHVMQALSGG